MITDSGHVPVPMLSLSGHIPHGYIFVNSISWQMHCDWGLKWKIYLSYDVICQWFWIVMTEGSDRHWMVCLDVQCLHWLYQCWGVIFYHSSTLIRRQCLWGYFVTWCHRSVIRYLHLRLLWIDKIRKVWWHHIIVTMGHWSLTPGTCGSNFNDIFFKLIIQTNSSGFSCNIALWWMPHYTEIHKWKTTLVLVPRNG